MAQEQNYQVNYTINVDASQGTRQVIAFGEAVGKLVQAKASLSPAVNNIKTMMDEVDRVFRTKNGKKRSFDYRLTIDTRSSEEKLERVKNLLTDIAALSKGISLTINAGQVLDSKKIKTAAKNLYEKKAAEIRKAEIEKNAASSVGTMVDAQKRITKAIGKINSAMVSRGGAAGSCKSGLIQRRKTGCNVCFPCWNVSRGNPARAWACRVECPWEVCSLPFPFLMPREYSSCRKRHSRN